MRITQIYLNSCPTIWRNQQIGWIRKDRLEILKPWTNAFVVTEDKIILSPEQYDYKERSDCLADAMNALHTGPRYHSRVER